MKENSPRLPGTDFGFIHFRKLDSATQSPQVAGLFPGQIRLGIFQVTQ
jgi:hypothetical protein